MVDLAVLKSKGATSKKLEEKFSRLDKHQKVKDLVEMGASRINEGISRNLDNARIFWAIDRAYDVAQRQITFTLVEGLLNSNRSQSDILATVKSWGLDRMLTPVFKDGKAVLTPDGSPEMKLDLPTFFHLFVPLVQAYTKIRWAKLFNDRNLTPLYKYDPIRLTQKNKLKTTIVTDRIQRMSTEMNYREDERQSILQALLYSVCINFPMEDWYTEKQLIREPGSRQKELTIREGVRFAIPHPARTIYDLAYRLPTLNSNTGVEWAGYWDVVRFGDIEREQRYWNRDQIDASYGKFRWPADGRWKVYQELFPCNMTFPVRATGIVSDQDRVDKALVYSNDEKDKAVTLCPLFMRLIPSEWDLYDYDHPVWHRFVYAAEENVIWCSPLAYTPAVVYLYDYDQNRALNTSLGLELLPWQDMLGNYLTQYLLTVKKNLGKAIFWNTDVLDQKYIEEIKQLGEKIYRDWNFIPFSGRELYHQQTNTREAFYPVSFPNLATQEIAQAINLMIMILERTLGYSSQEVGSSASHEQSATEVNIISQNTSTRVEFTGSFVDAAIHAKKQLLYDAMMAYSDDEIFAEVAELNEADRAALKEMGFEVEEEAGENGVKAGVKGDKSGLRLDGFSAQREGVDRIQDSKIAAVMVQTFQSIFSNPIILEQVGIKQLVDMFNQILLYAGLPRDFRLKIDPNAVRPQAEQVQEQLKAMETIAVKVSQAVVGQELSKVGEGLRTQVVEPLAASQQQLEQAVAGLAQQQTVQGEALAQLIQKIETAAAMAAPPVPPLASEMPVPMAPEELLPIS